MLIKRDGSNVAIFLPPRERVGAPPKRLPPALRDRLPVNEPRCGFEDEKERLRLNFVAPRLGRFVVCMNM